MKSAAVSRTLGERRRGSSKVGLVCLLAGVVLLGIALVLAWNRYQVWRDTVHTVAQVKRQTGRTSGFLATGYVVSYRYDIEYDGITNNIVSPHKLSPGDHIAITYRRKYPLVCSTEPERKGILLPILCLCLAGGFLYHATRQLKQAPT